MRLVLAVSALGINAIAPAASDGLATVMFMVLALYAGYSALLYVGVRRASSSLFVIQP